jgi:Restriction endonuclease
LVISNLFQLHHSKMIGQASDAGIDLIFKWNNGINLLVQCKDLKKKIGPDIIRELGMPPLHLLHT